MPKSRSIKPTRPNTPKVYVLMYGMTLTNSRIAPTPPKFLLVSKFIFSISPDSFRLWFKLKNFAIREIPIKECLVSVLWHLCSVLDSGVSLRIENGSLMVTRYSCSSAAL